MDDPHSTNKASFEEFKLFYESAEKVTDRRLAANRWNYSICIAILGANATVISWSIEKPTFLIVGVFIIVLLSGMAALYCALWIGQIRDLKALNNAKFEVLNDMADHVRFGDGTSDRLVSFLPFEREWDALQKAQATAEIHRMKIVALKSSNIEYLIPRAFRILFVAIMLAAPLGAWQKHRENLDTGNLTSSEQGSTVKSYP